MKIKRYIAASMRAALSQVRAEQGPDAVILSSRRVNEGIEVIAAVDYDEALIAGAARRYVQAAVSAPRPSRRRHASATRCGRLLRRCAPSRGVARCRRAAACGPRAAACCSRAAARCPRAAARCPCAAARCPCGAAGPVRGAAHCPCAAGHCPGGESGCGRAGGDALRRAAPRTASAAAALSARHPAMPAPGRAPAPAGADETRGLALMQRELQGPAHAARERPRQPVVARPAAARAVAGEHPGAALRDGHCARCRRGARGADAHAAPT